MAVAEMDRSKQVVMQAEADEGERKSLKEIRSFR
jgi:hypothetical protein